mgnify:CR=1 FL=1
MGIRLRMDINDLGAQSREKFHVIPRVLNHQMDIRRLLTLPADILDILQAHTEIRDKFSIHHIQMV